MITDLLRRYYVRLSIPTLQPELLAKLMRMQKLTPGDFAAVIRQNRIRLITSSADLVSALEAECALKEGTKSSIRFLQ